MKRITISILAIFLLLFMGGASLWAASTQTYSNVITKPVSLLKKTTTPDPPTIISVEPVSISEDKKSSFGVDVICYVMPDEKSVFAYEIYGLHYFGTTDNKVRYGIRAGSTVISSSVHKPFSTQVLQGNIFLYADTELSEKFILECGILGLSGKWMNYEKYKNFMSFTESNMIGISYRLSDFWLVNVSGRIDFDIVTTKPGKDIETNISFGLRYQI